MAFSRVIQNILQSYDLETAVFGNEKYFSHICVIKEISGLFDRLVIFVKTIRIIPFLLNHESC